MRKPTFENTLFYVVLDNDIVLLEGLQFTVRFNSVKDISNTFSFLWNCQKMSEEDLKYNATKLAEK